MTLVQIPKLTTTLEDFLKNLESIEPLFDALSSVVFFIKIPKHAMSLSIKH